MRKKRKRGVIKENLFRPRYTACLLLLPTVILAPNLLGEWSNKRARVIREEEEQNKLGMWCQW